MSESNRPYRYKKKSFMQQAPVIVALTVFITLIIIGLATFIYVKRGGVMPSKQESTIEETEPAIYTQADMDAALAQLSKKDAEALADAISHARESGRQDQINDIKATLLSGKNALEMLKPLYPDELVVVANSQYHFVPINRTLKQAPYTLENLEILDSGEVQYCNEAGEVISHKGIDVSKFQSKINWSKVKDDGVEFAIIRIGLRGYGTGEINDDKWAEKNLEGAIDAGIHTGVYFFTQAISVEEAIEEAEYTIDFIEDYDIDCPVVIDVEKVSAVTGRMNLIDAETRTDAVIAFCETIKEAGYRPMIYNNTEMGALLLDLTRLEEYPKWFAGYRNEFYYPYAYDVWQYTDTGHVSGITGDVDLNISFIPLWE